MVQLGFEPGGAGPSGAWRRFTPSGACWTKVFAGRGTPLLIIHVNDPSKL